MPPLEPHPLGSVSGWRRYGGLLPVLGLGVRGSSPPSPRGQARSHTVDPDPTRIRPAACHLREGGKGEGPLRVKRPLSFGLGLGAGTPQPQVPLTLRAPICGRVPGGCCPSGAPQSWSQAHPTPGKVSGNRTVSRFTGGAGGQHSTGKGRDCSELPRPPPPRPPGFLPVPVHTRCRWVGLRPGRLRTQIHEQHRAVTQAQPVLSRGVRARALVASPPCPCPQSASGPGSGTHWRPAIKRTLLDLRCEVLIFKMCVS